MTKQTTIQFKKELYRLFDARVHWLVKSIGSKTVDKPPQFNRKKVSQAIARLQTIASKSLADVLAKKEFDEIVEKKKQWHRKNKGWGIKQKRQNFDEWFARNISYQNCIYVFWNTKIGKRICLYVGKTEKGKGRPQNHFEKYWFGSVTRIDVYSVSSASHVMKLECLAKHRFQPTKNKIKPPDRKWYKKCPVCDVHALIRSELRNIFSLKRRKKGIKKPGP
jgi:hypothetical protein